MDDSSRQWIAMGEPAGEHEAAALRVVKSLLQDGPTTWAWSNLTFRDRAGAPSEVDVILLNRNGLFLIELKQRLGAISGNQLTWYVKGPNGRIRSEDNPANLARRKAQRLASLLQDLTPAGASQRVPFVHEVVVLHGRDSKVELDSISKTNVYGLDTYNVSGVPLFSDLVKAPATDQRDVIDKKRAAFLVELMGNAGFTARPKIVMVGQYALDDKDPVTVGPGWEDWRASQPMLKGQYRRVRLYPVPFEASQAQRTSIERTAQREYLLTTGLNHPGVVSPLDILSTDRGPALVFPDDTDSMALDDYLAAHRDELDLEARLTLIRKLGEILAYAHRNQVTHRGLTPMQVRITDRGDGPQVAVRDWQTGRQETTVTMTATRHAVLGGATGVRDLVDESTQVYLAPEALSPAATPDPIAVDVYGLGALAFLILTDSAPATNLADLQERLSNGGLDPAVQRDEIPTALSDLVTRATDPDTTARSIDVPAFLAELGDAEKALGDDNPPEEALDPLEAQPGDILTPDLLVEERLGSGATGVALLVSTGDADAAATVLKVAHDSERATRLVSEAEVLGRLDSPRIVQLLSGPHGRGGRTCIELADAGRPTLGTRIHDEGRLTIEQLQNYGRDLFEAVGYLESQGVQHRDIKPDNLGVRPDRSEQADRRPRLVLFDFSLANESPDHIRSGTRGYLDPFLGGKQRPRYDSAAERFAVAATLFHMATGQLPEWGDGAGDPAQIDDEVTINPSWFESQVADSLSVFFRTALAREITDRHDGLQEMATAWDQIFTELTAAETSSATAQSEQERDSAAQTSRLTTPLTDAGLTPRAVSALDRVGVVTVAELVDMPAMAINQLPGVGVGVRREIQRRRRQWLELRGAVTQHAPEAAGRGVEFVARHLIPRANGKNAAAVALATALLTPGDDQPAWPTLSEATDAAGLEPADAASAVDQLTRFWGKSDAVTELRMDVLAAVQAAGGMLTADEAAQRLVVARGSEADGPDRVRHALPLVRVAVDMDELDSQDLTASRTADGQAIVIALTDMGDGGDSAPRIAAARQLAEVASDAVAASDEPLAPIRSLALVNEHPDAPATGIGDPGRLLTLAAAISDSAEVSSRGELYRRDLTSAAAVAAVLKGRVGHHVVAEEWLRRTVTSRFPTAAPLPSRPALDELVAAASPDLSWDGHQYSRTTTSSRSLLHTSTIYTPGAVFPAYDAVDQRLRASLDANSAVVIAVPPSRLADAASVLADRYDAAVVNLTADLLREMKAIAADSGIDWQFLLQVDAKDPDSPDRERLARLVAAALDRAWHPIADDPRPLVITDVAPLARYGQLPRLAELVNLATPRPAARWILVPRNVSDPAPTLEKEPVPLGADGWTELPAEMLTRAATG